MKFQLFSDSELYGEASENKFTLPEIWLPTLRDTCDSAGLEFMCTGFSEAGYKVIDPYVNIHKLASLENEVTPFWNTLLKFNKPIIASLGAISEKKAFLLKTKYGKNAHFLECAVCYPATLKDYNLDFIRRLNLSGISDHTLEDTLALSSIGYGAFIFEKHFDGIDARTRTPDSCVSVNREVFTSYVLKIREVFQTQKESMLKDSECGKRFKRVKTKKGYYRPIQKKND